MRRVKSRVNAGTYPIVQILISCMRFALSILLIGAGIGAADAQAPAGADLQHKYAELKSGLAHNAYGKPLYLDSIESTDSLAGDVYAVSARPYASAAPALARPENWCDILLLVINTKQCRVTAKGLDVNIGRKYDEPLERTSLISFNYAVTSATKDFMQVRLTAKEGPLSTRDYVILLEAVPLADGLSFIHLSYSYGFGTAGRLGMQGYLSTFGRGKVGFTVVGTGTGGEPKYIGGMRGVIERNAMRYYLAIESILAELDAPRAQRFEKGARSWFAATERYPRQLHELGESEYLGMKRKEFARQSKVQ
jgi:hypothetical protein